jgi:uncharacterized protein
MIRVVIDTNVLVSALIKKSGNPFEIMQKVKALSILPLISRAMYEEFAEVLARPELKIPAEESKEVLEYLGGYMFDLPADALEGIDAPMDDAVFVAAARHGLADVLITGNKKHYAKLKHEKFSILTPAEFLKK